MSLRLLHLSDIHFKHFDGKDFLDQDTEIRNELEIDVKQLVDKIGNIDAVLIGGDIAFSGQDDEYDIADKWIRKICGLVGCLKENVLTVPGNHDIDRSKICPVVKVLHKSFKGLKKRVEIDSKLLEFLNSEDSCEILLKPLGNYMNFAQRFGVVPKGNPLFWEKDFPLDDQILRIRGINSAIVSSDEDNDTTSKLILGSLQTQLLRKRGIIYLVLCHHPPDWLIDGNESEKDFVSKAKVHMFGHKHTIRINKMDESLRLAAGAMQPSRKESEWNPRYNIIEIGMNKGHEFDSVKVQLWKRTWDKDTGKFKPDFTEKGDEIHSYLLKHEDIVSTDVNEPARHVEEPVIKANKEMDDVELIKTDEPDPFRSLTYLFMSLQYHKKIQIAAALKLIEDTDKGLSEISKSQAYIDRAKERGCLSQMWDMSEELANEKPEIKNPYKN